MNTTSKSIAVQDMDHFELPSSKLVITYSKRKCNLSENIVQGVQPDLLINFNCSDYKNGTDTMLKRLIIVLKQ
ncbi:hypothetical protein O4H26_05175 [Aequorivita viscosa]|nr:hypothetical protein [Aequorivita viscosa]